MKAQEINLINFYDYALAAQRTVAFQDNDFLDIGHFGFGACTEYLELNLAISRKDRVNIGEEIGDSIWFQANHILKHFDTKDQIWRQLTEIWWKPQYTITLSHNELQFYTEYLDKYADICMKYFRAHKKVDGYNAKVKDLLIKMSKSLVSIALNESLNPIQILNNNIQKLYDRYPEKFDSYLCMNRDLIKEYKTLSNI